MALIKPRGAPAEKAVESGTERGLAHYRSMIKLDRHSLDLAAEEQPQLFLDVAEQQVQAISRRDQAKDELLRADAKLGRKVREEMVAKGGKPTEGAVADYVLKEEEHLTAADKVAKLNLEVDEWSALRSALEHRKSMIRELATLYAAGYYTAGIADGARSRTRDKDAGEAREALARERAGR